MTAIEPTVVQLLAFESEHPRFTAVKEQLILDRLQLTPARYYQLLHRAARSPEGIADDPVTARRVRDVADRALAG